MNSGGKRGEKKREAASEDLFFQVVPVPCQKLLDVWPVPKSFRGFCIQNLQRAEGEGRRVNTAGPKMLG